MKKVIVNCETGEQIVEDFTQEEIAAFEIEASIIKEKEQAAAEKRAAALAKLEALGLDADDLKALGL